MALIQEKDFQKITVQDIVERADLNRGTFYLHFKDKYDMMDSFENEMIEQIERAFVAHLPKEPSNRRFLESRYDTLVQILTCFKQNKDLLQFLLKTNYASFQTKLRTKMKLLLTEEVFPKLELDYEVPVDLAIILLTSLSLSLAEYAFDSNTPLNVEQTANFLFNIVLHGPAKALGLLRGEG